MKCFYLVMCFRPTFRNTRSLVTVTLGPCNCIRTAFELMKVVKIDHGVSSVGTQRLRKPVAFVATYFKRISRKSTTLRPRWFIREFLFRPQHASALINIQILYVMAKRSRANVRRRRLVWNRVRLLSSTEIAFHCLSVRGVDSRLPDYQPKRPIPIHCTRPRQRFAASLTFADCSFVSWRTLQVIKCDYVYEFWL